ncbi:oxygen-independent coproporphyrinogen III oxidase [Halomonas rhizosphaerae]|uniref:Coproporphyrinogen-III oxidase n=1 Tax=Halomonas rhizosphaerae TaxID=3043296 RepID=A0ABT6V6B8_9GAMM|nr:oxygen-independent coproporphyrinogen III oxidase [Halomonas rhizosphaerae]MDI5893043.1 oxygen-independent coproporphyrinogen III oxidase [Halomonas rhizosphaerae]
MSARAVVDDRPSGTALIRDAGLLRRHAAGGPRYTSYPTADSFTTDVSDEDLTAALARSNAGGQGLSLYVHVPFCRQSCHHCACTRVTAENTRRAEPYLSRLDREMVLTSRHLDGAREIMQLHWGGGTPTFLTLDQMSDLIDRLDARFGLSGSRQRDYSIKVDPREADVFTLRHLQALGFNRLSLSVLDLDPRVQRAINRHQPRVLTEQLIDEAHRLGFRSLGLELIHGLPRQTRESFAETLEQVIAMAPARLSLFHYDHRPERFTAQRRIQAEELPPRGEQLAIIDTALARLADAGYVHIGMELFARPEDPLAAAQARGLLSRNLNGYSALAPCDHLGLGVGAQSRLGGIATRNPMALDDYEARLDAGQLPVERGRRLTDDDRLRARAIERLMCDMRLDLAALGQEFGLDAGAHLSDALARLASAERDGLVKRRGQRLEVTPTGRLLVHRLAAAFDARAV